MTKQGKMFRFINVFLIIAAICIYEPLAAQSQSVLPVELAVPFSTSPVLGNGEYNLVYEINLTNYWKKNLNLERIEVFDQKKSSILRMIEGKELIGCLYKPKLPSDSSAVNLVESGRVVIAFMWLKFNSKNEIPDQIYHRLTFSVEGHDKEAERFVDGGEVAIPKHNPIFLSLPFKKGYWNIGDGPANNSEHRRAILAIDGRRWLAQRFAFDAMKMGDDGKVVRGDSSRNENWSSYGEELLAVADGVVRTVVDEIPDNIPLAPERAVPMNRETHVGNCVVLDIGNNHFAFYAHLKAGSIPVKVGDKVKRGKVIGRIGNSGNSEAPHLHFSVGSTSDPYSAEGLPYVFGSFAIIEVALPKEDEFLTIGISPEKLKTAKKMRCKSEIPVGNLLLFIN